MIVYVLSVIIGFSCAKTTNELKNEIRELKQQVNELLIENGQLIVRVDDLEMELASKPLVVVEKKIIKVKEVVNYKNRLSAVGGLDKHSSDKISGVQYQRLLRERVSIGGQILSNDTYLLNLGFDF